MRHLSILCTLIFSFALLTSARAEEPTTKSIIDDAKNAVIQLEIVWSLKVTYQGKELPPQEKKVKINGTVISKDGLTVLSASAVTPSVGRGARASMQADPQSVMFIQEDGTEVEGEIALKDEDLDIMFVKPAAELEKPFAHIALVKDIQPEVLTTVVTMNRLSTKTDRAVLYLEPKVIGVVEKPRTYYVTETSVPGMPVFAKDGKCFGLFLNSDALGRMAILPAADILESASQLEE